jgi:hypothetical protein
MKPMQFTQCTARFTGTAILTALATACFAAATACDKPGGAAHDNSPSNPREPAIPAQPRRDAPSPSPSARSLGTLRTEAGLDVTATMTPGRKAGDDWDIAVSLSPVGPVAAVRVWFSGPTGGDSSSGSLKALARHEAARYLAQLPQSAYTAQLQKGDGLWLWVEIEHDRAKGTVSRVPFVIQR